MKPGKIIETEIINNAPDGRGVARYNGLVVFVHGACAQELVKAKIFTVHKTYLTAGVVEILKSSEIRQKSFCVNSDKCGGCPLSHIKYDEQLKIKKQAVCDALTRLGGIDLNGAQVFDTAKMEEPFRFRNKMVFPVENIGGRAVGGFYAAKSHNVIELSDCLSGEKAASEAMLLVTDFLNREKISAYNEKTGKGTVRRVFVRCGKNSHELMVVIVSATEKIKNIENLVQTLKSHKFDGYILKSVILNVNDKKNNLVLGAKNITLYGKDEIEDTLLGLKFNISPHSFYQVNPAQTEVLYKTALSFAEIDKTKTVLDIYCGIGTISLCAAKDAKQVVGVEIVEKAIFDAEKNAKNNGIKNASFFCGAAEEVVPKLIEQGASADVVIIDPPRKGSDEKTLSAIIQAAPERIVYVSCNPASLARDAKFLTQNGYEVKKVAPVDMFPNSEHIETICLFTK